MFDGGNTQVSFFESVDENTHLCICDGVNLLFPKHGKDVSLVSGKVSSMDSFGGGLFNGVKIATGNNSKGLGLITCSFGICGY